MMDRRKLMSVAAGTISAAATAQPAAGAVKPVFKQALPDLALAGWAANAVEVRYGPGEVSNAHQHPGFVLGYVLEGEVRFQLRGQAERIVRAGEMFYEPPGSVHQVSGNASNTSPARLLAIIFAAAELPLTKPA
jgi:quercetin dioxygenase-like cupin family protein